VKPLYDTRPIEKVLADLSKQPIVTAKDMVQHSLPEGTTYEMAARQGGLWLDAKSEPAPHFRGDVTATDQPPDHTSDFPLEFQAYPSLQFGEGAGAHLPWLQELPDPASSAIWGLPVEIDPGTAASLRIATGDMVRVESQNGALEAPAYVHPGAIPGVLSMPIGDGHTNYTRYASRRGANPISILPPTRDKSGAQVLSARVRLSRTGGPRSFTQFSAPDRDESEHNRR